MSSLKVVPIETAPALAALEPDWWALWRRDPGATPFTSPAWLIAWWRIFAPGELRSVALMSGGDLVGLAPLWLERGVHGRRLLPLGLGVSDLFDVMLEPTLAEACAAALSGSIGDMLDDLDACEFEELGENAAALRLPCPTRFRETCVAQSVRPVFPLAAELPSRKRRKLAMTRHRIRRRGGIVEPVDSSGLAAALADLVRCHSARWAERGEPGVLADPRLAAFHGLALPGLHSAGLARLYRLVVDGTVAGVYYGLAHAGTAYAYLGGFDPAFAFESPGTALIGHAIEEAHREGATCLDLLRGRERYKYEWGAVDRQNVRRSWRPA